MDRDALACDILIAALNGGIPIPSNGEMVADACFALADAMVAKCVPAPSQFDAAELDADARDYPEPAPLMPQQYFGGAVTPDQLRGLIRNRSNDGD